MLRHWRWYRERGWEPLSAADYAHAWQQWGGSVATHPEVVARLAAFAELPVRYLGYSINGQQVAAVPTWGRHLALSKEVLRSLGKRDLFDLGNAEVVLPIAPSVQVPMRHKARFIAQIQAQQINKIRPQVPGLALARVPEQYSKKFRYNQKREQRLLEEAGSVVVPMHSLSSAEQADIYCRLFTLRWQFAPKGAAHMTKVFSLLRDFMTGSVLYLEQKPIAIQILYRVEAPQWVSIEYINGGVDPAYNSLSPGSVLTFINTQQAWDQARALHKPLRYSFGRADRDYKDRWCHSTPVYQV